MFPCPTRCILLFCPRIYKLVIVIFGRNLSRVKDKDLPFDNLLL